MNLTKTYILPFFILFSSFTFSQTTINSLEDCFKIVNENNIQVQNSILDTLKTSLKIKQSKNSYLPTASFSLSHNYDFGTAINPSTNIRESRNRSSTQGTISVDWAFFEGFKRKHNTDIQKLNHLIVLEETKKIKRDIYLQILDIYSSILLNRETLNVEQLQLNRNKEALQYVNEKIIQGVEIKINSKILETKILRNELNIKNINNEYDYLLIKLKGILNINSELLIENMDNLLLEESIDDYSKKDIIDSFPELKELQYEIEIEKNNLEIIKSNYYPRISLRYGLNSFYSHILGERDILMSGNEILDPNYNIFDQFNNNKNHYLGVSLALPLFSRFDNKINTQLTQLNIQELDNIYNQRKYEIQNQIEQFNKEIENLDNEYSYQTEYLKELGEVLIINQEKYKLGIISLYDLDNFLTELEVEEKKLIQILLEHYYKVKALEIYFLNSIYNEK